jgi:hypothetical protein
VGSRGTTFVAAWSAGWVLSGLDVLFTCRLTILRKCAGEQAISIVVVIKTMAAISSYPKLYCIVGIFRFLVDD